MSRFNLRGKKSVINWPTYKYKYAMASGHVHYWIVILNLFNRFEYVSSDRIVNMHARKNIF